MGWVRVALQCHAGGTANRERRVLKPDEVDPCEIRLIARPVQRRMNDEIGPIGEVVNGLQSQTSERRMTVAYLRGG